MGEYVAHVIDAAKKIRCAEIQIHMRALHLQCATWPFLPIHSVASEVPRPGQGTRAEGMSHTPCPTHGELHIAQTNRHQAIYKQIRDTGTNGEVWKNGEEENILFKDRQRSKSPICAVVEQCLLSATLVVAAYAAYATHA